MEQQPIILVTGANGQLGKSIRKLEHSFSQYRFVFASREDLKLHHFGLVENFFIGLRPQYCINCAAYTAVDKAETEPDAAMLVNGEAVGYLAAICKKYSCRFIHISTDYVFNGNQEIPYKEEDVVDPINVYGRSKLMGEQLCMQENSNALIIRTSWVYAEFGHNFVKTMLRLMAEREAISVVNDQVGAPTYATDLASVILSIICSEKWVPGIYHFSNAGKISWYDFAVAIARMSGSSCRVNAIPTSSYPTPAKRPRFSLLNCTKIQETYAVAQPEWEAALQRCLMALDALAD